MEKNKKDKLVSDLVSLFKSFENNVSIIDEAVEEARRQLRETERIKFKNLERLFNKQIRTLKERGCSRQIIEMFQEQGAFVLEEASKMLFAKGNIPFLPVIPITYKSLYDLMAMVRNGDKQGANFLKSLAFTDECVTPDGPYYIFNVEDGRATINKNPGEAIEILKNQSRSPLTLAEAIALCIHTDKLINIYACGSRYEFPHNVPYIYLAHGQPCLHYCTLNGSYGGPTGSPSCSDRMMF